MSPLDSTLGVLGAGTPGATRASCAKAAPLALARRVAAINNAVVFMARYPLGHEE